LQACSVTGRRCIDVALGTHNGDVDSAAGFAAVLATVSPARSCTAISTRYGSAALAPAFEPWGARAAGCALSSSTRVASTFSCAAHAQPFAQRLCFCVAPSCTAQQLTPPPLPPTPAPMSPRGPALVVGVGDDNLLSVAGGLSNRTLHARGPGQPNRTLSAPSSPPVMSSNRSSNLTARVASSAAGGLGAAAAAQSANARDTRDATPSAALVAIVGAGLVVGVLVLVLLVWGARRYASRHERATKARGRDWAAVDDELPPLDAFEPPDARAVLGGAPAEPASPPSPLSVPYRLNAPKALESTPPPVRTLWI
jgi:hypothetical protein